MGAQFPDLVISEILIYIPKNSRLSMRLISSDWDFRVNAEFQKQSGRLHLWRKTDFQNFVNTFKIAKHGVPFRRYIVPPGDGSDEEFHAFVKLVGPHVIELTANIISSVDGIKYLKEEWQRQEKPEAPIDRVAHFFHRLDHLLQYVPNLIYLGIMDLGEDIKKGPPVEMTCVPYLPSLKIFSRVPADRYSDWCCTLIRYAPLLKNASEIKQDSFNLERHDCFDLLNPLLVNGYPINNCNDLYISNVKKIEELDKNFIKETQYRMFMRIMYWPSMFEQEKKFSLPPYSFRTVIDLYFEELSIDRSPLQIQEGQFPNLRRLFLNIHSMRTSLEYPFQNCVLPTVETLTIAIRQRHCAGWNIGRIFPNLQHLHIYFRSKIFQFEELRDLVASFRGNGCLVTLILEDTYYNSGHTEPFVSSWEEIFGVPEQHDCVTDEKVDVEFTLSQHHCSKLHCPRGKDLVFPGVVKLEFAEMKLQKSLPSLITKILSGEFPALKHLVLSGCRGSDRSPLKYPNADDYDSTLSQLLGNILLEVNT